MNKSKCLYKGGGNMEKMSLDFAKSHVENSHCGNEVIYWILDSCLLYTSDAADE